MANALETNEIITKLHASFQRNKGQQGFQALEPIKGRNSDVALIVRYEDGYEGRSVISKDQVPTIFASELEELNAA